MLGVGVYSRIVVKKKKIWKVPRIIFSLARALASLGKLHYFPFGTRCEIGRTGGLTIYYFLVLRKDDSRGGDLEAQSFAQLIQTTTLSLIRRLLQPSSRELVQLRKGFRASCFYFCIARGKVQYRTRP